MIPYLTLVPYIAVMDVMMMITTRYEYGKVR